MWFAALVVAAALLVGAAPHPAAAGSPDEAARQLQLAEDDLTAGNYERAAASATSALRLDPALQEALVVRALALKGLGRLEDAAALLRAYKDLRGTLPADERVAPAMAELERLLAAQRDAAPADPQPSASTPTTGPLVLFYAPDRPGAAEDAFAAAGPFLGDAPPVAVLPLRTILPAPGEGLLTYGAPATHCGAADVQGEIEEHLAAAELAAVELDPTASDTAAAAAELHIACAGSPLGRPEVVARLLAARAAARWVAGEPEVAGRLWGEAFNVDPERAVDASLSPTATALQLSAKSRVGQEPLRGRIDFVLPTGWGAWVDGRAVDGEVAVVARGRRLVRVLGPDGGAAGAIVTVAERAVLAATAVGLLQAAESPAPSEPVLRWLTAPVGESVRQAGAVAGLVVNLEAEPPSVRRFEGASWLLLSADMGRMPDRRPIAGGTARGVGPSPGSVALLAGGLAATAVGVVVAAVSHRDGVALVDDMGTASGFSDNYLDYEALRTRERVGAGIAVGGGVLAGVGVITFVIPTRKAGAVAEATR